MRGLLSSGWSLANVSSDEATFDRTEAWQAYARSKLRVSWSSLSIYLHLRWYLDEDVPYTLSRRIIVTSFSSRRTWSRCRKRRKDCLFGGRRHPQGPPSPPPARSNHATEAPTRDGMHKRPLPRRRISRFPVNVRVLRAPATRLAIWSSDDIVHGSRECLKMRLQLSCHRCRQCLACRHNTLRAKVEERVGVRQRTIEVLVVDPDS